MSELPAIHKTVAYRISLGLAASCCTTKSKTNYSTRELLLIVEKSNGAPAGRDNLRNDISL